MKIGIIGAGQIGSTLARRFTELGHEVFIANSLGPASLAGFAKETGATAVTVSEAARAGKVVVVTIPEGRIRELSMDLFHGVPADVVVIDTGNYYPRERDGRIDEIEGGMAESRWVQTQLGRPVVKAFNNIYAKQLLESGRPADAPARIALPVAGDDAKAKEFGAAIDRPTRVRRSGCWRFGQFLATAARYACLWKGLRQLRCASCIG